MERLILRSTSVEALKAELHRADLLREAATGRRVRVEPTGTTQMVASGPGFVGRVRVAVAGFGRPARADCPDCA